MKKLSALCLIFMLCASCGSVRLRYDGKFKTKNGKEGDFVFEKSYEVGSLRTWCILTGWIYGGACWFYFGLPNDDHERLIDKDAELKLKQLVKGRVEVGARRVTRLSWEEEDETHRISGVSSSRRSNRSSSDDDEEGDTQSDQSDFIR